MPQTYKMQSFATVVDSLKPLTVVVNLFILDVVGSPSIKVTEAVARRCFVKKVFLEFSKINRKTPVSESFLWILPNFLEHLFL